MALNDMERVLRWVDVKHEMSLKVASNLYNIPKYYVGLGALGNRECRVDCVSNVRMHEINGIKGTHPKV